MHTSVRAPEHQHQHQKIPQQPPVWFQWFCASTGNTEVVQNGWNKQSLSIPPGPPGRSVPTAQVRESGRDGRPLCGSRELFLGEVRARSRRRQGKSRQVSISGGRSRRQSNTDRSNVTYIMPPLIGKVGRWRLGWLAMFPTRFARPPLWRSPTEPLGLAGERVTFKGGRAAACELLDGCRVT